MTLLDLQTRHSPSQQVEEASRDRVETTFIESVNYGPDAERVFPSAMPTTLI